ncbi:MAG: site-2 protease family protein [Candidatus Methanomethylicia archaeon]
MLTLVLTLIIIYTILVSIASYKKLLSKCRNVSFYGPFIMLKTSRGNQIIDRISRYKFPWIIAMNIFIAIYILSFIIALWLIINSAIASFRIPASAAPTPQMLIGIPGVNPFIPLWYGIVGLIFSVFFHEFSHGIASRVGNIRIKSMGILFLIVPLGAFVEPDDEELKKTSRLSRVRVYVSGPAVNIMSSLIFLLIFTSSISMVSFAPIGVAVDTVFRDSPAYNAGIRPGMVIVAVNSDYVKSWDEFFQLMSRFKPNDTVKLLVRNSTAEIILNITLDERFKYTGVESDRDKPFLGVANRWISIIYSLANPFSTLPESFLELLRLPFIGLAVIQPPYPEFYSTPIPSNIFWPLLNTAYWIFWLNLMIGLTNVLPIVPLDGGLIVKETIEVILGKISSKKSIEERSIIALKAAYFITLVVVVMILMPMIIPRILNISS